MMTIAKENLGLVLASVFFFAVIFYASFSGIYSGDLYWHLKVGEDFLFNGLNPFVDHYSVDFVGKKFLNYTLIFDSLAAVFYSLAGGEQGLQIMRLCLLSLPFFFLMIIGYKRKMNHLDLIWALSLIVACLTFRKLIRPELCSYGLTMMFALALFRKNLGFRSLIFLMLVQWSWQFVHSTAVFGYVLLAGIYLNLFLQHIFKVDRNNKELLIFFTLGLATLGLGFLTPNGGHLLLSYLKSDPRWHEWIIELRYKSFFDREWFFQYLCAVSVFVPIISLRMKNFGATLVSLVFTLVCFRVAKLMPHVAIISGTIGLLLLNQWRIDLSGGKKRVLNFTIFVLTAIQIFYMSKNVFTKPFNPKPIAHLSRFPIDTIENLKSRKLKGRAINSYLPGGYLTYHLAPELKIYIDGRTNILFPYEYFDTYNRATRDLDVFNQLDKEKAFDHVIGLLTENNMIVDTALESRRFGLSEVGSQSVLLSRIEKSDFPRSSFYFRFPQCIDKMALGYMAPEIQKVAQSQIQSSQLRYFFKTIIDFYKSRQPKEFLKNFSSGPYAYNVSSRFAAYQALRLGELQLAANLFSKSTEKYKSRDMLILVDLLCKIQKCEKAYPFFIYNVDIIMPNWKRQILKKQLTMIKKYQGDQIFPDDIAKKVEERLVINEDQSGAGGLPDPCVKRPL